MIPTRYRSGGRLHVAPEVDTSKVLVPDSTKPEDDEVLYLDDRLDRAVSAPGDVLFLKNSGGIMVVGECLGNRFFHRGLGRWVSQQCMGKCRRDDTPVCQIIRFFAGDSRM